MEAGAAARQARQRGQDIQLLKRLLLACGFFALEASAQSLPGSARVDLASGTEKIFAHLFRPEGAERRPAAVIVHGSAGVTDPREGFWARELVALGMVALVTDSFTPRGVESTAEDQSRVTTTQMLRDAFAGLAWLAAQDFVDAQRVAVMGFSKGGSVALLADDQRAPRGGRAFAAHLPFYPSCTAQYRNPRPTAPMLMLVGEDDNYVGVKPCAEYLERIRGAGGRAELKVYPDAHHGFDGDTRNERVYPIPRAQNFRDCIFYYEDDGRAVYPRTGEVLDSVQKTMDVFRRDCLKTGASYGANYRAKMRARDDVVEFLKTVFRI